MQHVGAARPLFDVYALARIVASSTAGLFFALSALFVARRLAGGMVEPLPPSALLLIGATLAAIASFLRLPWLAERTGRAARIVGVLLPLPAIVLFCAALSLPGAAVWSIVLLWIGLIAHEAGWGYALWRGRRGSVRRRAQASPPLRPASSGEGGAPPDPGPRTPTALLRGPQIDAPPALEAPSQNISQQNVTQQIVRTRESDAETITGVLRAQLEAGERTHSLHVAFCPPLASTPVMQCEQSDGPAATIALGEVQSYGARIDLRLSRPAAKPIAVTVEFYARG